MSKIPFGEQEQLRGFLEEMIRQVATEANLDSEGVKKLLQNGTELRIQLVLCIRELSS